MTTPLDTRVSERAVLIERGRTALRRMLPGVDYAAIRWETAALAKTTGTRTQAAYFTCYGSETEPLPASYAGIVKAWIVLRGGTASRMTQRTFALRWLWRAIEQRLGAGSAKMAFSWDDLREQDLRETEQLMIAAKLSPRTINKAMTTLADLTRFVANAGAGPTIVYVPTTPRQRDTNTHRVDDLTSRSDGVLTSAAIEALADIFYRASEPRDVFWSSVMALLIATGIRWNEVVTLPLDCLVDEPLRIRDVTGAWVTRSQTYLRRWKSKSKRAGGAGTPSLERVPLTAAQALLAHMAVERLVRITTEARGVAQRLEGSAPRWRLELPHQDYLWAEEICRVLNCSRDNANLILREVGESTPDYVGTSRTPPRRCTPGGFEGYMTARQDWNALVVVKPTAGDLGQRASESLLCVRVNETRNGNVTLPLVQKASHAMLRVWLAGSPIGDVLSVFERFEREHNVRYREPDGSLVEVSSHMCRRLFVTTGLAAGATTVDITRWQGREHIGDLAAYDRRSMAEKVAGVKDAIKHGRLQGQVAQAYVQIADDIRDIWLEGQVQAMHVTPYGLCVHDFSATPCPLALNCVKGCKDYLYDPTNPTERQGLVQLQRRTKEVLDAMEGADTAVASAWLHEHRATLNGVERILATQVSPSSGYIAPFAYPGEGRRISQQGT